MRNEQARVTPPAPGGKRPTRVLALIACIVLLALTGVAVLSAGPPGSSSTVALIAGGGNAKSAIPIGTVTVAEDGSTLYVTYQLDTVKYPDWVLAEVNTDAGLRSADIPQSNRNPVVGKFYCSQYLAPGKTSAICAIPFSEITSNLQTSTIFTVAAHAKVQKVVGGTVVTTASAWGAGTAFGGKNWATYFTYDPDLDNDGLWNSEEAALGTDPNDSDTDDDGLLDGGEIETYHTDPLKADTDADGLSDGQEIMKQTDPLEPDSDGDGLKDGEEVNLYGTDPLQEDTDGDQFADAVELRMRTLPLISDTDRDSIFDGIDNSPLTFNPDQLDSNGDGIGDAGDLSLCSKCHGSGQTAPDTDGDGLAYAAEMAMGTDPELADTDEDGFLDILDTNPLVFNLDQTDVGDTSTCSGCHGSGQTAPDTDDDGLFYAAELAMGTLPDIADTDGDGILDRLDNNPLTYNPDQLDPDGDGIGDISLCSGCHGSGSGGLDTDDDGLTDVEEVASQTDPLIADTDGDGLKDGEEVKIRLTDPLKEDTDGDGLSDGEEVANGTNPTNHDTDGDTVLDGDDNCPLTANPDQADADSDGIGDACDTGSCGACHSTYA